jgi:hypothetical protein
MSDIIATTGEATASEAPASFGSLAADVLAQSENPGTDEGQAAPAADAPAGEAGDLEADAGEGTEGGEAPEGESAEQAEQAEILNALEAIDRDTLTPEQQVTYDELLAAHKSMQADYTRKTQKVAEQARTMEQQVAAEVEARMAALREEFAPQTPEAPADADFEAQLWSGLGEPVSIEQAIDAEGPEGISTYIMQQATFIARREVMAAIQQVIAPQLSQVNSFVTEQQANTVDGILTAFTTANPDIAKLEGGVDLAIQLVQGGVAKTLDDAAPMVRSIKLGDQKVQQATQLGIQAGAAQAKAVKEARERINVPSGATVPHTPAASQLKGQGFGSIAQAIVAGIPDDEPAV